MKLMSHMVQRQLGLDPPLTRDLVIERDLPVPMPDGTVLLADRWAPRAGGDKLPVALMRSPYGRGALITAGMVRPLAERGFQVILQSARGTFGSGGAFEPMRNEREDGLATLEWVVKQPWFGDSIVLVGPSYLGYVQWAVADRLPPEVKAMIPQVTDSALTLDFLRADAYSLETPFGWGVMIAGQERRLGMLRGLLEERKTRRAMSTLPLGEADVTAIGRHSGYIQDILQHDADDPYWAAIDHRSRVADVSVPVSSVGGWYDIFLPGQLRDFAVLQQAGRNARLTVGPWTHLSMDGTMMREALEFGLACARGAEPPPRGPVRLYVMGEEAWRDFESWPPPGYSPRPFYLGSEGTLAVEPLAADPPTDPPSGSPAAGQPADLAPDRYRYDPADPTPAIGGVRMVRSGAGRVDNTPLEARPDVLTYTTAPLESDVEVVGEVSAQIWFRSSLPEADVFVRLCDVDADGKSWNVCDGLTSLSAADQVTAATVRLWPTAHRFKAGHRIRVQVSSGSFPRYARNPGTGEPRATAARLLAADQSVYHDPGHPSAITLPVRSPGAEGTEDAS
jgi:putative CocE/NonD family hydrolase